MAIGNLLTQSRDNPAAMSIVSDQARVPTLQCTEIKVRSIVANRQSGTEIFVVLSNEICWSQPQPLMQLHEEENAKGRLICSLLPQKGPYNLSMGEPQPPTINDHCEYLLVENFLADSDAESNGQKDAIHKDEKKDNAKGLSVAFDPATGPPEEAPQGKVQLVLL